MNRYHKKKKDEGTVLRMGVMQTGNGDMKEGDEDFDKKAILDSGNKNCRYFHPSPSGEISIGVKRTFGDDNDFQESQT